VLDLGFRSTNFSLAFHRRDLETQMTLRLPVVCERQVTD
jgi:hypothetical protein